MVLCIYFPFGKVSRIRASAQLCVEGPTIVANATKQGPNPLDVQTIVFQAGWDK